MFNTLGRFKGMNDEMGFIVLHSLAEYPAWQAEAALAATAQQLVHVATGEGTNGWIGHTYGIIERYIPAQLKPMRAAQPAALAARLHRDQPAPRSGRAGLDAAGGDRCSARGLRGAGSTISRCWPATVTLALLGNAFICGVISGPHDRYGARMAWVATFVVLIAAVRHFRRRRRANEPQPRRDRKSSTPVL